MRAKRYKITRKILIFLTLFVGIGAVGGALAMFIDPTGGTTTMNGFLPYLQTLPFGEELFSNLIFSGISLLIVNGISNIISAILLLKHKKLGIILGTIFGFTLMLWITIQFVVFPFNFMSTLFFCIGVFQLFIGIDCLIGYAQSSFTFNESDYTNINKGSKTLVVFFSRTGYTKKYAYNLANETGSDICEIKTTEKIDGNLGFWWCGRFGMHKWGMKLENLDINLENYEKVIICSPIWVFGVSSPIREFCKQSKGKIKNAEYVFLHFLNINFTSPKKELDLLLGIENSPAKSVCCQYGSAKC